MVEAALTAPAPGYAVLYGISANTRAWWDLEPGRALGYEPRDDAEEYADTIAPGEDDDAHGGARRAARSPARSSTDRRSTARLDLECTPGVTLARDPLDRRGR